MKFNLKYLILPLSTTCCINFYNVSAMEDTINEINQPLMSWVDFEAVLASFSNNEQLNNIQIDFIRRIANEITYNVDNWRNLITRINKGFPRGEPKYPFMTDDEYNLNVQNKVNTTKLSNQDILCYTCKEYWIKSLYHISKPSINYYEGYKEKINSYITFINRIKSCYKKGYINKNECVSLLNWLLYNNIYSLFLPFSLRNWNPGTNYQTFNYKFYNYLLDEKTRVSLEELYYGVPLWKCTTDDNTHYAYILKVINTIIDNLISLHIDNSKLKQITPVDFVQNTRYKILEQILHGIYDALYCTYYKNIDLQQQKELYKILNSQTAINKIDTEFNITNMILSSLEYKAYEENYDHFINYYHGLRMKSENDLDYNKESNEKIQRPSLKDIQNKIKTNKLDIKTDNKKSEENDPMSAIVYSNILPFLIHTNLDTRSNTNNQTQNNINEINTNNDQNINNNSSNEE